MTKLFDNIYSQYNIKFPVVVSEEKEETQEKKFQFNDEDVAKIDKVLGNYKKHYAWYEGRLALKKDLPADGKSEILTALKPIGMGEPMLDAELNEIYFVTKNNAEKENESQGAIDMLTVAKTAASNALYFLTTTSNIDIEKCLSKTKEAQENINAAIIELQKLIKK